VHLLGPSPNGALDQSDNNSVYRLTIGADSPHQPEDFYLDQPDNNSVYRLTIGADSPHQPEDFYLRSKMTGEAGARDLLGEWTAIRVTLFGLKMMMARAECAAAR
jgi:hypothetical protein